MKMVGFRRAEALWFFTKLRRFDIPIRHTYDLVDDLIVNDLNESAK